MRSILLISKLCFTSFIIIGCSTTPEKGVSDKATPNKTTSSHYKTYSDKRQSGNTTNKSKLIQQHHEWRGTPYAHGGLSKRGIDCSGFVYLTYRNKFGIDLPRSTLLQSKTGVLISQAQLITGDLLFFKTGRSTKHVGIYVGNRKFLHASTSKGVTISSMDNTYWRKRYWKAQRLQ